MTYEIKNNFHVHLNLHWSSYIEKEQRRAKDKQKRRRKTGSDAKLLWNESVTRGASNTLDITRRGGGGGGMDDDVPRPNFYRRNKWIRVLPIRWPRMATRHGAMIPRPVNIERMAIDVPNTYIHVYIGKRCCIRGKQGRSFRERE